MLHDFLNIVRVCAAPDESTLAVVAMLGNAIENR